MEAEDLDLSVFIIALFDGLEYGLLVFQQRVRRILQVRGRILGTCNKHEKFIADTRTSVAIIPRSDAEKIRLQWVPIDSDEPDYKGVAGMQLAVIGQTEMFIKFKTMRNTKVLRGIVCEEEGDEILVDLDTLIKWSIIPKSFPLPMDPKERVRM